MELVTKGNPVNSWLLIPTTLILWDISLRTCMLDLARPPLAPLLLSWVAALLALAKEYCLLTLAVNLESLQVVDLMTESN